LICLVLLATSGGAFAADKLRALVLTGETDLPYHDWRLTTPFLRSLLVNSGRFDVKVEEEVRGITAATLAGYDVLVLNYNGPRWGTTAERAVEDFLRSGKGMIAVHDVSYGPFYGQELRPGKRQMAGEPWLAYADMMGMSWKLANIGHSKRHVFTVKWVDRDHPVSRGLDARFVADDELYHKMHYKPNVHVLASAYSDPKVGGTGNEEPMIWTVPFGTGRVVHITLGHDLLAMSQSGFVEAFARGTEWAGRGAVTLQPGIASALKARDGLCDREIAFIGRCIGAESHGARAISTAASPRI
jgi:type 1 glutamine amidotransferase